MPKVEIGSNAQFTSAGEGLTVIGKHAYAYSGAVAQASASGEVTKLDFNTGKEYIVSKVEGYYGDLSTDWFKMYVYFNDILILQWATNHNASAFSEDMNPIHLIIPPLTRVKISTHVGSDADYTAVTLVGEVYG